MTALAPCPVADCDGKSPFLCSEGGFTRPDRPHWFVSCANCSMRGPRSDDADQAIGRWNALAAPASGDGKWQIDRSTDSPILTYEGCSVIQDDQSFYVLRLVEADQRPSADERPWRDFTEADARYCAEDGTLLEVQCDDREFRQKFRAVMCVGSPQWRSHVAAGNIVRWRPAAPGAHVGTISGNVLGQVPAS